MTLLDVHDFGTFRHFTVEEVALSTTIRTPPKTTIINFIENRVCKLSTENCFRPLPFGLYLGKCPKQRWGGQLNG
mgnify:CR=1 FL=1